MDNKTYDRAIAVIQEAEWDLGPLSPGQRRDLLKDNMLGVSDREIELFVEDYRV